MKPFKLLFSAALAIPFSSVICGHAVSAPGDQDWRTLAVPDFGTRVQYPAGIFTVADGKPEKGVGPPFRSTLGLTKTAIRRPLI
jgi:hypothetical protein